MEELDLTSWSESSEWVVSSPEAIREKSEKQKESYKKAQAQIQKAQKDEKKAKNDNDELFQILTRFIQNPYYETLIPRITDLLSHSLPSRPIIGMLALVYPDASHYILHHIGQWEKIHILKTLHRYPEPWSFHESSLDGSIREWITLWIDAFDKYIITSESSLLMQKRFISMIDKSESIILSSIADFFTFFFQTRNIIISAPTTDSYARFILKNIRNTLYISLQNHPDKDITIDDSVNDSDLFWFK